jgi:hypothetical protein
MSRSTSVRRYAVALLSSVALVALSAAQALASNGNPPFPR